MKKYLNVWWIIDVVLAASAIIMGLLSANWLSPYVLIPGTISVLMIIVYSLVLDLARADIIFTGGDTESFGLSENNGQLVEIILFSDDFHMRRSDEMNVRTETGGDKEHESWKKWDILPLAAPKGFLEREMNARWMGMWWNRDLAQVTLHCHDWKDKKNFIGGGTEPKKNHTFDGYIPLFHTHAYITDELEIAGNFHVKGAFTFRFRFVNPYLAFYQTSDVIGRLDAIARDVTRLEWATKEFEELKKAKFATIRHTGEVKFEDLNDEEQAMMGNRLMYFMNAELDKYGIMIIDINFVDLVSTRKEELDLLTAKEKATLQGEAQIESATKAAEVLRINTEAKAAATLVQATADAKAERKRSRAFFSANGGNPQAMFASVLRYLPNLRAIGSTSSLLIDEKGGEPTTTTPKPPTQP